jgi:hypothetical protein
MELRVLRAPDEAAQLLDFENEAFQVFGLWQVENDGMVDCGSAALQ